MTGRTFGKRGINDGGAAVPRAAFGGAQRARTFQPAHREAGGEQDAVAMRRAAFLAEERARAAQPVARDERDEIAPRPGAALPGPIFVREKSLGAAYVLWFFLGGLGAHRFYLGYPISGAMQVGLWVTSWSMIAAQQYLAVIGLGVCGLWVLTDGFLVRGLHRQASERTRRNAAGYAFA